MVTASRRLSVGYHLRIFFRYRPLIVSLDLLRLLSRDIARLAAHITPDEYPYDLGALHRRVTTTSGAAQRWFDRGLVWTHGFNQGPLLGMPFVTVVDK
jgi:hypothetical protein